MNTKKKSVNQYPSWRFVRLIFYIRVTDTSMTRYENIQITITNSVTISAASEYLHISTLKSLQAPSTHFVLKKTPSPLNVRRFWQEGLRMATAASSQLTRTTCQSKSWTDWRPPSPLYWPWTSSVNTAAAAAVDTEKNVSSPQKG